ncbi:MAG: hypothetical protein E4G96_07500 [Chrysiogenales bacterium]|nr:MAG: hypothetical protein E4G96_07500 [Chrysiogenales bacterium]
MSSTIGALKRHVVKNVMIAMAPVLLITGSPLTAADYSAGEEALIWLQTKMHEREYRKNMRKGVVLDAVLSRVKADPEIWTNENPTHPERLAQFTLNLRNAPKSDTIAFGDSLLDLTRKRLNAVHPGLNFSTSGSWAHHMARMAADVRPALKRAGIYGSIKYVIVGSLGGNPLLMRQPVDVTIAHSLEALDAIRRLYPAARIIVFGIPPTVSMYVNLNAPAFEAALYRWVLADRDAVMLPLQRQFAGMLGLFPKAIMSVDGVHFSRQGTVTFDQLLEKGKRARSKAIVD